MVSGEPIRSMKCLAIPTGILDYMCAWDIQRSLSQEVACGALPNLLLLVEHPHVYTLGRRGRASDILVDREALASLAAQVHFVDRGGEATYHGPGQLVGYPIVDLRRWGGPLRYVRALETCLVATLSDFGIEAHREGKLTGVWAGDAKIAAIGVKVSRGVTTHGFALNVNPDLSYFDHIVPCGIRGARVASMASVLSSDIDVQQVIPALARRFGETFGWRVEWSTLEALGQLSPLGNAAPRSL